MSVKLVVVSVGQQLIVQNLNQLYVLVSSALPTTHHIIADKELGVM